MINLRKILNVKFIMIVTLATLFILTTSSMQAQASRFKRAKCPCDFWSALNFAKKAAAKIGGHFEINECIYDSNEIEASGENDCSIELEAESDVVVGENECEYLFQCGDLEQPEGDDECEIDFEEEGFALALEIGGLTDAEVEACRQEIKIISKFVFGEPCEFDELGLPD